MPIRTIIYLILLIFICCIISCCTAGRNDRVNTPGNEGKIAGFWLGLWHGFISPITFFLSLFMKSISFYEVHNNGGWYNFGFVLGAGIICGSGDQARRHALKDRRRGIHISL